MNKGYEDENDQYMIMTQEQETIWFNTLTNIIISEKLDSISAKEYFDPHSDTFADFLVSFDKEYDWFDFEMGDYSIILTTIFIDTFSEIEKTSSAKELFNRNKFVDDYINSMKNGSEYRSEYGTRYMLRDLMDLGIIPYDMLDEFRDFNKSQKDDSYIVPKNNIYNPNKDTDQDNDQDPDEYWWKSKKK